MKVGVIAMATVDAFRNTLAITALGTFLIVMTPWLARNYDLSGTPFGTAGYAVFENTSQFPPNNDTPSKTDILVSFGT